MNVSVTVHCRKCGKVVNEPMDPPYVKKEVNGAKNKLSKEGWKLDELIEGEICPNCSSNNIKDHYLGRGGGSDVRR